MWKMVGLRVAMVTSAEGDEREQARARRRGRRGRATGTSRASRRPARPPGRRAQRSGVCANRPRLACASHHHQQETTEQDGPARAARPQRRSRRLRPPAAPPSRRAAAPGRSRAPTATLRRRSVGTPRPSATTIQATRAVHPAPSTRRVITASRATPAPAPSNRGTSRMRSFATSVSSTAEADGEGDDRHGKQRETCAEPARMRQEDRRRQRRAPASGVQPGPLQKREVAAGVLEQRALVDHRQLEVGVGVVHRLTPRLRDDDEQERHHRQGLGGIAPHGRARGGAAIPRRSVVEAPIAAQARASTSAASTATLMARSRLAPCSANPFPVSHAAADDANRPSARRPSRTSASCPTGQSGAWPAIGTSRPARASLAATMAGAKR